jgi:aminoglycoside phosphotransferase family enzyme/gluconate kinase
MTSPEPASTLIESLRDPRAYPHPVRDIDIVETHISWVVLTGDYAYKLKKPIRLEFVDFSTLALRKRYCEDELRLNRRLAPQLYEAVVPIGGTHDAPRVGREPAFEYAVRMRQFPAEAELERQLAANAVTSADMRALGERIARFHASAATAEPGTPWGEPAEIWRDVAANLDALREALRNDARIGHVEKLARWSEEHHTLLRETFTARKAEGRIREGHGDLHLRNLVRLEDGITPFDCIEFDPRLRWIDVIADVAFLVMDLELRNRADLAYAFLDAWLEETGDYGGVAVLDYYRVYRSLVRAKVAAVRATQLSGDAANAQRDRVRAHVDLALGYSERRHPRLFLMHGYSGSGKSWLAERLVEALPALRIRSDVERKRLAGLAARAASGSQIGGGLYAPGMTSLAYARLEQIACDLLLAGENTVVDATFLSRAQREPFLRLARNLGVHAVVVDCDAPISVLEERLRRRGEDASEADIEVLRHQLRNADPVSPEEPVVRVRTDDPGAIAAFLRRSKADVRQRP